MSSAVQQIQLANTPRILSSSLPDLDGVSSTPSVRRTQAQPRDSIVEVKEPSYRQLGNVLTIVFGGVQGILDRFVAALGAVRGDSLETSTMSVGGGAMPSGAPSPSGGTASPQSGVGEIFSELLGNLFGRSDLIDKLSTGFSKLWDKGVSFLKKLF